MKYDFDEIIDRKNNPYSFSVKWSQEGLMDRFRLKEIPDDMICLQIADMDFKTAPEIIEDLKKVSEHGVFGYSQINDAYRQAVVNWYRKRQNWDIEADDIIFVPGTHMAIFEIVMNLTNVGDGIIIPTPSYPYHGDIEAQQRQYVCVKMNCDQGYYTIDYDALEKACQKEENKLMIIIHPHNPTGRIWSDEELLKIADICRRNDVIMISDEVHSDIIRAGLEFHPMMKVVGPEGLITCTAVNKTFNLAGLSCTNLIIHDQSLKERVNLYELLPSPFGIQAVISAYNKGDAWVDALNQYLDHNLEFAIDFIEHRLTKAKCRMPEGGYIIWLDLSGYGFSDEELHHRIFDEAHIIIQPGSNFDDTELKGQVYRLCLPSPLSVVQEAFERLERVLEKA